MMKIAMAFNVPFYEHEVPYEAAPMMSRLRGLEGVQRAQLLKATEGEPRFLMDIECADEAVESITSHIKGTMSQYTEYISGLSIRSFRPIA